MTEDEKLFLVSFKEGKPNWELLGLSGIELLPAVKWKQLNLDKMNSDKRNNANGNRSDSKCSVTQSEKQRL